MKIAVHVQPGAKNTSYAGLHGENPKIKIAAPPAEGLANNELIHFISKAVAVPKTQIKITSGQASRFKIIEIDSDITRDFFLAALENFKKTK